MSPLHSSMPTIDRCEPPAQNLPGIAILFGTLASTEAEVMMSIQALHLTRPRGLDCIALWDVAGQVSGVVRQQGIPR